MNILKSMLACGSAAAAAAFAAAAAPAFAQSSTTSDGRSGAPNAGSAIGPTTTLGEVVVTASRRAEKVQDVPGQVGTVSGAELNKLKARTLEDFAAFTPGVSFQNASPAADLVVIRGVTTGGTQLSSAIGLYLDDVPIGSSTAFGGGVLATNIDTFDLQRVEVLNGPQGTLYGANSLGGTLKYITAPPQLSGFSGRIEGDAGYTEHGSGNYAGRGMINIPLVTDRLALRLDAVSEDESGYTDDPGLGRKHIGDARIVSGRAALLAEITPDLTVKISGFGQRISVNGSDVSFRDPVTHQPTQGPYDQSYEFGQPGNNKLAVGSGTVDWNLHWAKLTSVTAYQSNVSHSVLDDSVIYDTFLGPLPIQIPGSTSTDRFTQEVRLASPDNHKFEWVVGGFYSHEDTTTKVVASNLADPNGLYFGLPLGFFSLPSTEREYAVFGDATIYFTPKLDATVGIRYSMDHQVFTQNGSGLLVNAANPFLLVTKTGTSDESVPTYLFNVRYHFTPHAMVYGRIATGFRPGGPNLITNLSTNQTFKSDKLINYEVGFKADTSDGRGSFDASVYHIDWSSIQLGFNVGGTNQVGNGGDAAVTGVETSFSYHLAPQLSLIASGSYSDAKLTTPAPQLGVNYDNARLPLSPKFSGAVAADYTFQAPLGLSGDVNVAYRYVGTRTAGFAGSAVAPLYALASYGIVDATMSLRTRSGLEISPFIKNLLDKRGEVSASTINNPYVPSTPVPVALAQPRTFGVTIGQSF